MKGSDHAEIGNATETARNVLGNLKNPFILVQTAAHSTECERGRGLLDSGFPPRFHGDMAFAGMTTKGKCGRSEAQVDSAARLV